ncbi:PACE efflux transporter [Devosia sp. YIM 151766]|uniref:PACE efflux transporter n=1 Tax=Devosia sp. YIM 151766 TaxID=3017325 RepID=UPI00255CF684|nr:PACE efflux transporter [Devosia sp. YIM 151766]WIY52669.1 PACE efflux transporter [Devosia sp. YIM 151766]
MRTTSDRIRHAVSFELIGIVLATPLAAFAFHLPGGDSAVIVVGSATVAMAWNYVYNLLFDHAMRRWRGNTEKSLLLRVLHAMLFELGLLIMLLPLIAFYLGISLWQALVMDIAFALFYMGYAFVFNLAYDRVFPLPEWREPAKSGPAA